MRGRKPTPTRLRVLRGNPGKRKVNKREPRPSPKIPLPPEHLDAEGKKEWDRISQELYDLGLLTGIDRAALSAYCTAWQRWVDAEKKIKKHGLVLKSPNGYPIYSPYLAIANKAMKQMKEFLAEFGMTPSSRSRVTPHKKPDEQSPLNNWLKKRATVYAGGRK